MSTYFALFEGVNPGRAPRTGSKLEGIMQIGSLTGYAQALAAETIAPVTERKTTDIAAPTGKPQGDRVNISLEARQLFAKSLRPGRTDAQQQKTDEYLWQALKKEEDKAKGEEATPSQDPLRMPEDPVSQTGSASQGDSIGEQIKQLESQIQQLQSQLISIMSGPGTAEQKYNDAQPVQQQLNQAVAQLEQLKSQLASQQNGGGTPPPAAAKKA